MAAINSDLADLRRGPGPIFWWSWVGATLIGSLVPLAWSELGVSVLAFMSGQVTLQLVLMIVLGIAPVGIAQALVLYPYFKTRGSLEWLAATIIGQLLVMLSGFTGIFGLFARFSLDCLFISVIFTPLIAGIIAALAQWFVLRERVAKAWQWLLAQLIVVLVTIALLSFLMRLPDLAFTIVGALIVGGITGYVMERMLRVPGPKAEWDLGWREGREYRLPKKYEEERQLSPEELLAQRRAETPREDNL